MTDQTMPDIDHSECAQVLKNFATMRGIEVSVSEYRPGMTMRPGFKDIAMQCPHGIRMWMEPTNDQVIRWLDSATVGDDE